MKNYMTRCCSIALLALMAIGCKAKIQGTPEETFGKQSYYEVLLQGTQSNFERKEVQVITTEEALKKLYEVLNSTRTPGEELPTVDFEKQTVIAGFAGLKSSGGYGVEIYQVRDRDDERVYKFRETAPSSGDEVVTMAMTTPYLIIIVSNDDKKITASF